MDLQVYNTLSQQKETFAPLVTGKVRMYCCGPTVYDYLHVGNFRGAVFYNFVRNWLEKLGYQVDYAYNFTDVDDKILRRAQDEGVSAATIAERYIEAFWQDFNALRLTPHSHNPRVTDHMADIIQLVEQLIANDKAYVAEGEVFYSIQSFVEYGKLSGRKPEGMQSGVRIEVDSKKRNPLDFSLWKPAKPDEEAWDSPWGKGRPGWHIECSAMTRSILGDQIDIHGGGMDLIFPHHENEIAQSEGATCKPYARYWLHNNMFTFSGAKMSKSLGNIRTMRSFLQEFNGEIFKYLVMSVHYRSESEFSDQTIHNSIAALGRVYSALARADELRAGEQGNGGVADKMAKLCQSAWLEVEKAFNDDFNSSKAMAQVFEVVRSFNQWVPAAGKKNPQQRAVAKMAFDFVRQFGEPMALFQESPAEYLRTLDDMMLRQKGLERATVDQLVAEREQARANKQYQDSDRLRDQLADMGIEIRDTAAGTEWEVRKGGGGA